MPAQAPKVIDCKVATPSWTEVHPQSEPQLGSALKLGLVGALRPVRLALITAGQSPRAQIVSDLMAALPVNVKVTEFGALDGLGESEIARLAPSSDEASMATQLRDGRHVQISEIAVYSGIQGRVPGGGVGLSVAELTGRALTK